MSMFSGKCDFADHIAGLGGWYDKDGNPVKFGQEGVGAYYSDELQDFKEFKRKTGNCRHRRKRGISPSGMPSRNSRTSKNHHSGKTGCPDSTGSTPNSERSRRLRRSGSCKPRA